MLTEFHCKFPGSVAWRVTPGGVEIQGQGLVTCPNPEMNRTMQYMGLYKDKYLAAAHATSVPVELLIACSLTESAAKNPETCVRLEPGYVSDDETPDKISTGFCQMLISTARWIMGDNGIGREWLCDVGNALMSCAKYIKRQSSMTGFDPVYVACAYNAGGLYENKSTANRWRLRQAPIGTSKHADRFVAYFNAAMRLTDNPEWEAASIRRLLV